MPHSPDPQLFLFPLKLGAKRLEGVPAPVEGVCSYLLCCLLSRQKLGALDDKLILDPSAPREKPLRKAPGGFPAPRRGISRGPGNSARSKPVAAWRLRSFQALNDAEAGKHNALWKCLAPKVSWQALSGRAGARAATPFGESHPNTKAPMHCGVKSLQQRKAHSETEAERSSQGFPRHLLTSRQRNEVRVLMQRPGCHFSPPAVALIPCKTAPTLQIKNWIAILRSLSSIAQTWTYYVCKWKTLYPCATEKNKSFRSRVFSTSPSKFFHLSCFCHPSDCLLSFSYQTQYELLTSIYQIDTACPLSLFYSFRSI